MTTGVIMSSMLTEGEGMIKPKQISLPLVLY